MTLPAPWAHVPAHAARAMVATEYKLHCMVALVLEQHCLPTWRYSHLPFGELRAASTSGRLKAMGVQPGWPDFILVGPGKVLFPRAQTARPRLVEGSGGAGDPPAGVRLRLWHVVRLRGRRDHAAGLGRAARHGAAMSGRWLRLYDDAMHDPKVKELSPRAVPFLD